MKLNLKTEDVEKIHLVKAILEKEYKRHYSYPQLAQKTGTNEYKLKHGFKQIYNMTIFEYRTAIRIEKAKELLANTEHAVNKISYHVGFKGPAALNKSFKKLTGFTPLEWKRNHLNYHSPENPASINRQII